MNPEVIASQPLPVSSPITNTTLCGCCKRALDYESSGNTCRTCGETRCNPSETCNGRCACDRNVRGFITQMWFRKSNEVYGFFLGLVRESA